MSTARNPAAALARWTELNDRQQGTLAVIYELDQAIEASRRKAAARYEYDRRPASEWRSIDFAHDPHNRELFGMTEMQSRLAMRGWDNQGNGSTVAALADRGLLSRDSRPVKYGRMLTVRLTNQGRAAARAGTSTTPGAAAKAALGERSWEVLARLWAADKRGRVLEWGFSRTIEHVLIGKHVPPLAERVPLGYAITDRGRDFYREQYAAHAAAHPDVQAPHPDGAQAEPWPRQADHILGQHWHLYDALRTAWQDASTAQQSADAEATTEDSPAAECLPPAVTEQTAARRRLWHDTASQRAELAAAEVADLHERCVRAARAYAVAALAAFAAAVAKADPLDELHPPADDDTWDEQRLAPPDETGIHAIDTEARKLHAAAVGAPLRRRGPAPKRRTRSAVPPRPEFPGRELAALADFLRRHVEGGALTKRLHGARPRKPDTGG